MSHFVSAESPSRLPDGTRHLLSGQAASLRSERATSLRILGGRAWVTLGEGDAGVPGDSGDRFLAHGEALCVPAGSRLVMEPFSKEGDLASVHFSWAEGATAPSRFSSDVVRPADELVSALQQASVALGRLLKGPLGYSGLFGVTRGEALPCFESKRL